MVSSYPLFADNAQQLLSVHNRSSFKVQFSSPDLKILRALWQSSITAAPMQKFSGYKRSFHLTRMSLAVSTCRSVSVVTLVVDQSPLNSQDHSRLASMISITFSAIFLTVGITLNRTNTQETWIWYFAPINWNIKDCLKQHGWLVMLCKY